MELTKLSIQQLISGYKNKNFSALEVTEQYLKNIKEKNKDLGAYIKTTDDIALAKAEERFNDKAIPMAVKDNINVCDVATTCASKIFKSYIPSHNATVIERLNDHCLLLGKTNMDEFAMGSSNETSAFFPVKNPWDQRRVSGGSSGGSAAAVAADLTCFALGSDTGGSIRQPSSFCGVVGLRPTYGLVSRHGLVAVASSMDQIGTITKTVEDSAYVLSKIAGRDKKDPVTTSNKIEDYSAALKGEMQEVRIGLPKQFFTDYTHSEINKKLNKAITTLEQLGAKLVEVNLPHIPYSVSAYTLICAAEAWSNLARIDGLRHGEKTFEEDYLKNSIQSRTEGFGVEVKRRILLGAYILNSSNNNDYYLKAQKVRTLVKKDFQKAFQQCDVILGPTTPSTAFKLEEKHDPLTMYLHDSYTTPVSLAGLPAISLPCGQDSKGMPIGLQLIAPAFSEGILFNVGNNFQQATDYHKRKIE
ncbi:Asp-tRNA(Asn)/Glu-tRNA(Gln) amidotransferase subunit GatA [Proteinivorax tanatarense]|uniref:Glutamyl-tRNA(Gln) amidotransferase subunit A n=1 Tax=Proteinivorax tanatarense TaxID=1260629 RepID=A0AAU7VPD9_9FIRM